MEFSSHSFILLWSREAPSRHWLLVRVFLISIQVSGDGFLYLSYILTCLTCSDTDNMHSDVSEAEINNTISKCGINQEIIQKSCGDGKIEKSTLHLLMGIFRSGSRYHPITRGIWKIHWPLHAGDQNLKSTSNSLEQRPVSAVWHSVWDTNPPKNVVPIKKSGNQKWSFGWVFFQFIALKKWWSITFPLIKASFQKKLTLNW